MNPENDPVHKITHSVIASQIALNKLEAIKHTPYYKRELKKRLNLVLPELIKAEKDYDEFFNNIEGSTVEVYEAYESYVEAIASVPIWDCRNITAMIAAYKKDPHSIQGIVNKINRKT